jgi:hypothetical protein
MQAFGAEALAPRSRAINVPLAEGGSGISRLLTDNRLTRSARSCRPNTLLCKQGVPDPQAVEFHTSDLAQLTVTWPERASDSSI